MPVSRVTIPMTEFYSMAAEKTKFNWFAYEIALSFQSALRNPKLAQLRKRQRITELTIATFSIIYAKHMQTVILKVMRGELPIVEMSYEPLELVWPQLNEADMNTLQEHLGYAWDGQLESCGTCPTRCISEKDYFCELFDDPYYLDDETS